jgi:hypothetical protein
MIRRGLLLALAAAVWVGAVPAAAQQAEKQPAVRELYTVLAYGDAFFDTAVWRVAAAEETDGYTSVLYRQRANEDILTFFLYLHFDAGATAAALDDYFDKAGFRALLANYDPWRQTAACVVGDVRIYEFSSKVDEVRRALRYWVRVEAPTRVLGINAVVPEAQAALLDEIGAGLFPDAVSCAAG